MRKRCQTQDPARIGRPTIERKSSGNVIHQRIEAVRELEQVSRKWSEVGDVRHFQIHRSYLFAQLCQYAL